jgi:hypothetical protein
VTAAASAVSAFGISGYRQVCRWSVAVADRAGWWWPFAVILAIGGFSYLLGRSKYGAGPGLSKYGVGEELPADDADDGHQARFPVTH